jgi:hypothetical protein
MRVTAPRFISGQQRHPFCNNEEPLNVSELAAIKEILVAVVQPRIISPNLAGDIPRR